MILGFDPGGERAFGCALLDGGKVTSATVSSVDEAVNWARTKAGSRVPSAAGIDTLLHWTTARGGWRPCDRWLRTTYPAMVNSFMSPNSLFGAMGIGGMALAIRLREVWPGIALNETHPKVLLHARGGQRYRPDTVSDAAQWFGKHAGLDLARVIGEHALDAVLSGWATMAGVTEGWPDIIGDDGDLLFPAGNVSYLWPRSAT